MSELLTALEAFRAAADARRRDLRSPERADALVGARRALDESLAAALARVPYRTRRVSELRPGRDGGHAHLAAVHEVSLRGWSRRAGQTLCGEIPGRPAPERPVTCAACLRQVERHRDAEPDPPALEL
jgi:hypothetical protein